MRFFLSWTYSSPKPPPHHTSLPRNKTLSHQVINEDLSVDISSLDNPEVALYKTNVCLIHGCNDVKII